MPVAPAVDVEEQPGSGVDEAAEGPKLETDNDEAATFEPIPLVLEDLVQLGEAQAQAWLEPEQPVGATSAALAGALAALLA